MGKKRAEERRKAKRIRVKECLLTYSRCQGLWSRLFGEKEKSKPLPIRNISRDGVCFLCREELEVDEELQMTMSLGENNPTVRVDGKVMRCEEGKRKYPWKVSVGFTNVSEDDWDILCRLDEICPRRKEHSAGWRLHHTNRHDSRPKGSLHTPDEYEEDKGRGDDDSKNGEREGK